MCGIAGIIHHTGYDLNKIKHALIHRGPDDQSIYTDEQVALIHTRLAIQDIPNGKQPFHYGHCSIVFNGEIYNHKALRNLLIDFHFRTKSDTETLLYLYLKYGENMFCMLDGMFAFCIYDRNKKSFILARDRSGKKPLYYMKDANSFLFASELNAIKTIKQLTINPSAIQCFLRAGFIFKHYTPYQDVYRLEAGSFMTVPIENRSLTVKKYYHILEDYYRRDKSLSFQHAVNCVEDRLKQSVRDRMTTSDIEVGAFLSGGIDSNLIVAMASQFNPRIKTFTVKFEGLYDESPLAKLAAQTYQTTHTELDIAFDISQDIEKILLLYGEPFMDSSAIPSYYIAKEAKNHMTVILNGDGGDELFGGYRRYVPFASGLFPYVKTIGWIRHLLPKPKHKRNTYDFVYRLLSLSGKSGLPLYLSATSNIYEDILALTSNPILDEMSDFVLHILKDARLSLLAKMLYLDFNLLLFSDLLVKIDIASMAHSLEGRSPFLSRHLLKLAPSLPDQYKINRLTTKYILRTLAKKYLPAALIDQPKRGFEVPLQKWVDVDLKERIYDQLRPGCYAEGYVKKDFIDKLLKNKNNINAERRAKILWGLFCLETWYANESK